MSKYEIAKSLKSEIKKINYIIDQKIIQGRPYHAEARRHKFLISQLHRLTPPSQGWFSRGLSFASLFMF